MRELQHPNIVNLIDFYEEKEEFYIALELLGMYAIQIEVFV